MSWMQKLCEAYDAGIVCNQSKESSMLIPLGFTQKEVRYHVIIDRDGQFISADMLPDKTFLMIPSTPQAESRTGRNFAPYPLIEQLKYLVYGEECVQLFQRYMNQLKEWCEQPDAPKCLQIVYDYLEKHTLLEDLESQPNFVLKYFKDTANRRGMGADAKAMVCFSVQMPDNQSDDLWRRQDVQESWSRYLSVSMPGEKIFCYVQGSMLPAIESHPKVRGNAKLISAKDNEFPFQYKGRFVMDRSAATVSYGASIRAHNALDWLIARQGMQKYGMFWVVWNTNGAAMRMPIQENNDFDEAIEAEEEEEEVTSRPVIDMFKCYALQVKNAALGYGGRLHSYNRERTNEAIIMGLEAATDGRMSITYYQECLGNDYVHRLEKWYKNCCWYYARKNKVKTPVPKEIAAAVMGMDAVFAAEADKKCEKSNTKRIRQIYSGILSCIIDEQSIPLDIVRGAFRRACMPHSFVSNKEQKWSRSAWENCVDTTCALIRFMQLSGRTNLPGSFVGDNLSAESDLMTSFVTDSENRDFLYGRLFAIADFIENVAAGNPRDYQTNAVRCMTKFAQRPYETWTLLHGEILPYLEKLGESGKRYQKKLGEIELLFPNEKRYDLSELSFTFLQGFSLQRQEFYRKNGVNQHKKAAEYLTFQLPVTRSELYGCLLAIADVAEIQASGGERNGKTNAMQLMQIFAARPSVGWVRIHDKLIPYLQKLGEKAGYYQWLIGIVEKQFLQADREKTGALDGSYLHGFYCMRQALYSKAQFHGKKKSWMCVGDKRNALYGQMLGLADCMENQRKRQGTDSDVRFTNELRWMTIFSQKPAETWKGLKIKLIPYIKGLGERLVEEQSRLKQIEEQLRQNGWFTNEPLSSIYLHFYYDERNK